ncbi:hypothetical protein BC829DRAFT_426224 [Chytridium lagenaria]|nr:hypothetical protein BC829DRAFT_426224 [Chytridium lagenaria]
MVFKVPINYHRILENYVNKKHGLHLKAYDDLYACFGGIISSANYKAVLDTSVTMDKVPKWFGGAKLNYAENLMKYRDQQIALIEANENGIGKAITFAELAEQVKVYASALRRAGLRERDVVAAYLPNVPKTVIVLLAVASIGAIWSSASPDLGPTAVLERFGQIEPKFLFSVNAVVYNGKTYSHLDKLKTVAEGLLLLVFTRTEKKGVSLQSFLGLAHADDSLVFEQLPFDHPLFILYSSGTTGKPKCIVHSAGGALIQHPIQVNSYTSWDLVDTLKITVFGTSAKYIASMQEMGIHPRKSHSLASLRHIYSTGSPLYPEQFDFVYSEIKEDVLLGSITGGTDIISLFAGHKIMNRCLGMAVESWDSNGKSILGAAGDLVCVKPFPVMPVFFWNDPTGEKYHGSYFSTYPNVWYHGDFVFINPNTHGVVMLGRSDGTLKPGGVRFGSSELYNVVAQFDEVSDCLAVGQRHSNDERVVMFLKSKAGFSVTDDLIARIRSKIRDQLSPRIVLTRTQYTHTGKKVEIAVKKILNGETVTNTSSLVNPESLKLYEAVKDQLR